jgi:hypothetical protein
MSLEQLLAHDINPAPASVPGVHAAQKPSSCRAQLTADELAALREVWSTPLEPAPAEPIPSLLH